MNTEVPEKSSTPEGEHDDDEYPSQKVLLPAMIALYFAVFVVSLDRTILGTAIPSISNEFDSFGDISWYESGFLLPLCMLQLSFGLIYRYYSPKWVIITLVAIFEVGSIVSATAPNSRALIVGRVVTGIGGAGITSGALTLINLLVPLQYRPQWTGGIGAAFGIASIIGPLVGGYLTAVTWRWCFWINVPIGGITIVILTFLCPNRRPALKSASTLLGKLKQLDPIGFILIAPSIICLLFALQWGPTYGWTDGRVTALFVVFGVLLIGFVASQIWLDQENKTIPTRIISQRSIIAACISGLGIGSNLVVFAFFLPIWFQAIKGKSSQKAGLSLLPLLLSQVITVIISGVLTSKIGYYTPFVILGSAISIIGTGLLTTFEVDTGAAKWIGYQIVTGIGGGMCLQAPNIAAQTVLSKSDAPVGITLVAFIQFLGGTIFVTVSQVLLESRLIKGLEGKVALDASAISSGGATSLRSEVPAAELPFVLQVYNESLTDVWYLALALACLIFLSSWGFEWRSVKTDKQADREDAPDTAPNLEASELNENIQKDVSQI